MSMAANLFASLPCCLPSQFSAPDNVTKNVAFFSQWLGSFMVTHDRKIVYRRGDGCADCITEGDAAWANKIQQDQSTAGSDSCATPSALLDTWRRTTYKLRRHQSRHHTANIPLRVLLWFDRTYDSQHGLHRDNRHHNQRQHPEEEPTRNNPHRYRPILLQATKDWIIASTYRRVEFMITSESCRFFGRR